MSIRASRSRLVSFAWLASLASAWAMEVEISVPSSYKLTSSDSYVCTTVELPSHPLKLIGVKPRADMEIVHHILLYGCHLPFKTPVKGKEQPAWDCGHQSICADGGSNILYGWGRNAPQLNLPEGVGFSVGAHSGINYVVAQVHFLASQRPPKDNSGVTLVLTDSPVPFSAGIIAFASGFVIPPKTNRYPVENECCYEGSQPLTTFAVRVHTHTLGRSVYMTRPAWNHSGLETLAQRDPLLPQAFVPLNSSVILPGDRLKVTCDFDSSSRSTPTSAGMTHNDEMCNMYMMVYSWFPFINFCVGAFNMADHRPGTMSLGSSFVLDPSSSSFWTPPDPTHPIYGEMTGVAVAADGALWGLYRGDRIWDANTFDPANVVTADKPIAASVLLRMDPETGTVLSTYGHNTFYMPHMITFDFSGNIWVTDVGLHQVLKFSPEGNLLHVIGEARAPGKGKDHFCKPTKVAFLRDGSFYVADGYCNSRLVKFGPDGKYVSEIEVKGGVVIHYVHVEECKGLVHAVSRENGLVISYDISSHAERSRSDLHANGRIWALMTKPQGGVVALAWDHGKMAKLVDLSNTGAWDLPGLENSFPHELALGPGPLALSNAGERVQAIYVVLTCPPSTECGPLKRFVQVNPEQVLPPSDKVKAFGPKALPTKPVLVQTTPSSATDTEDAPDSMDAMKDSAGGEVTEDEGGDEVSEEEEEEMEEEEYDEEAEEEEKEYEEEIEEEEDYEVEREEEGLAAELGDEEASDYEEEEEEEKREEDYEAAMEEAAKRGGSGSDEGLDYVEEEAPQSYSAAQIIGLVTAILAVAAAGLVLAIHFAKKLTATPSLVEGSAGAKAGFKPLPKNERQVESFSEMIELSRTLEMDDDVEGGRRGKDDGYKMERKGLLGAAHGPLPLSKPSKGLRKDLGKD